MSISLDFDLIRQTSNQMESELNRERDYEQSAGKWYARGLHRRNYTPECIYGNDPSLLERSILATIPWSDASFPGLRRGISQAWGVAFGTVFHWRRFGLPASRAYQIADYLQLRADTLLRLVSELRAYAIAREASQSRKRNLKTSPLFQSAGPAGKATPPKD